MYWYQKKGNEKDVVVSTRVRLARNLADYPFEGRLTPAKAEEIIRKVTSLFEKEAGYEIRNMADLSHLQALSLCERHYISPEFAEKSTPRALITQNERDTALMVCEEDHLRIQCIKNGLAIEDAYVGATEIDDLLDEHLEYAYDEKLGYLTHCPTNLGTAMRVSVMMFLPAITMAGQIEPLKLQLQKIGLAVRGLYGEGSDASGCLYQISNQVTLGITEEGTLKKVREIVSQIAEQERRLRQSVQGAAFYKLIDRASRAEGVFRHARLLSSEEFLKLYADLRLGLSLEENGHLTYEMLDSLLFEAMPATVSIGTKSEEGTQDLPEEYKRDLARARTVAAALA
ncbi:MAG: ATP--guanido phosphotransferase [Clostridia bacterium]|nr:ATP--guanido phosphotransferase [Clostridia bacterium]